MSSGLQLLIIRPIDGIQIFSKLPESYPYVLLTAIRTIMHAQPEKVRSVPTSKVGPYKKGQMGQDQI